MDSDTGVPDCLSHARDNGQEIHWQIGDPAAQQRTGNTAIGGYIPSQSLGMTPQTCLMAQMIYRPGCSFLPLSFIPTTVN